MTEAGGKRKADGWEVAKDVKKQTNSRKRKGDRDIGSACVKGRGKGCSSNTYRVGKRRQHMRRGRCVWRVDGRDSIGVDTCNEN